MRYETWRVALEALGADKLRAFLTMLGVVIGSAGIVLVVTIALTAKRYIVRQIEGSGSNLVYAELVRSGQAGPVALNDEISIADLEAARQGSPLVVEVAGTQSMESSVVVEGAEHVVDLVGVTEGFNRIRHLIISRGRFFDAGDMSSQSKVCLITEELSSVVFPNSDPIGRTIHVGELSFTVIGVFRERVSTFGQSEISRESLLIPFPLLKFYTGNDFIRTLYAQAGRPEDVGALTWQVQAILQSRHRSSAVYEVQNLASILETARKISSALTITLLFIATLALTISGINIMNIMIVTVTERTHEIGIRRALGAPRREILYQFLFEAILISGTGGIIGVLIAVSIPLLTRPLLPGNLSVPVSWISVVLAFGVSCFTGIVFGYIPANKAAKLPPAESLRAE